MGGLHPPNPRAFSNWLCTTTSSIILPSKNRTHMDLLRTRDKGVGGPTTSKSSARASLSSSTGMAKYRPRGALARTTLVLCLLVCLLAPVSAAQGVDRIRDGLPSVGRANITAAHHSPIDCEGFEIYFACEKGVGVVNPAHALDTADSCQSMFTTLLVALCKLLTPCMALLDVTNLYTKKERCPLCSRKIGGRRFGLCRKCCRHRLHERIRCKSRPKMLKKTAAPASYLPLHLMFRGGGDEEGPKATERKRMETRDERLLLGLQELLQSFRADIVSLVARARQPTRTHRKTVSSKP